MRAPPIPLHLLFHSLMEGGDNSGGRVEGGGGDEGQSMDQQYYRDGSSNLGSPVEVLRVTG